MAEDSSKRAKVDESKKPYSGQQSMRQNSNQFSIKRLQTLNNLTYRVLNYALHEQVIGNPEALNTVRDGLCAVFFDEKSEVVYTVGGLSIPTGKKGRVNFKNNLEVSVNGSPSSALVKVDGEEVIRYTAF